MIWNPTTRQYEDERGKPIPTNRVRAWIENYIDANKDDIEQAAKDLIIAGAAAVLITAFFEAMRDRIKSMHGTAGVIAYGGEQEMNPERWARVADVVSREFGYLKGFEAAVNDARRTTDQIIETASLVVPNVESSVIEQAILTSGPPEAIATIETIIEAPVILPEPLFDTLIWGEVGSRSRMYADATYSTWANSEKAREMDAGVLRGRRVTEGDQNVCAGCEAAASDEYVPLEDLLDIGDADCLSNCRCTIEFDYHGIEPLTIDREIYA